MDISKEELEAQRIQNEKERETLIAFIKEHPNLRPWQAIYAWSGVLKITVEQKNDEGTISVRDPFYWETKNK